MSIGENTYTNLAEFGKKILDNKELDQGLMLIAEYLKKLKSAMRCSIFICDKNNNELWTVLADGIEKIIIPTNQGIVGQVCLRGQPIIENDVTKNPHFLKEVDINSGYSTINMIACPIFNSDEKVIGVLQLLNKSDGFDKEDLEFLNVFTKFISSYIELAPFYNKN